MTEDAADDISTLLLNYLRSQVSASDLTYAEEPARISGGFDTAIYGFRLVEPPAELSRSLILRVYRDGGVEQARFETAVQGTLAEQGYPAPRMLLSCLDASVLGGAFVIMPRVAGRPMIDRMFSPAIGRIPVMMADAQAALHAQDPAPLRLALETAGLGQRAGMTFEDGWAAKIEQAQLDGLRDGYAWVASNRPAPSMSVLCHGDFHPLNVMVDGDGVSGVLDWANARIDDPAWDVGATVALFGYAPVELPAPALPVANFARRWLLGRYLKTYESLRPIDMRAVRYFEAVRLLGFVLEAGMVRQARAGVIAPMTKTTAFEDPAVLRRIRRRFEGISGVPVWLPVAPDQ